MSYPLGFGRLWAGAVGGRARQGCWQGCHGSVPDGQAVSSLGVRAGGTWGCQGGWQVETQRPVTGGEHGSVREDRAKGMEVMKPCLMR